MMHFRFIRHAAAVVALFLSMSLAFGAHALAAAQATGTPTPQAQRADFQDDHESPATGNLAELQDMVQANRLTELRATRNGSYGAKLYFLPADMLYYVALSQDTRLWRVVKTQEENRAEAVYAQFARKTHDLSDGEIRRVQLQAQKELLERVIAVSANRANRLSADLALAQQQDTQVSERQQQLQVESAALQSDKLESERKLRALQMQVEQLQRATEAGLGASYQPPAR